MQLSDLALVMAKLGVDSRYLRPTRPNQLLVPCPLAKWTHKKGTDSSPSCSIRFGDPASPTLYNCFSCKESGKLWDLVHSVGSFLNDQGLVDLALRILTSDEPTLLSRLENASKGFDAWVLTPEKSKLRILNNTALENYPLAWTIPRAIKYLESRRVTPMMAQHWGLRWHSPHNRVIFPVRDEGQFLVGAVGRAIFDETQPKYYNLFGFETGLTLGGRHWCQGHSRVAVVEGFHCLMNVWWWNQTMQIDTVCTFTSRTSEAQAAMLQRMDASIFYMYDMDEAGDKGWAEAHKLLSPTIVALKRVCWSQKHLDIGDMDQVQYMKALAGTL